jgi:hypothetical protein
VRGGSVNYGGMDDGYVPDYHTGRRISAAQYQQQQYEQVRTLSCRDLCERNTFGGAQKAQ